jgi:hypothetical protein
MKNFTTSPYQSPLTTRDGKIQYRLDHARKASFMLSAPRFRVFQTVLVDRKGRVRAQVGVRSYRAGLAALFDLNPRPTIIRGLAKGEPTRLGFARVGAELRDGFAKARTRHAAE